MKIVKHLPIDLPSQRLGHSYNLHYPEAEKALKELSACSFQVWIMLKVLDPYGSGINIFEALEKFMPLPMINFAVQQLKQKGFVEIKDFPSEHEQESGQEEKEELSQEYKHARIYSDFKDIDLDKLAQIASQAAPITILKNSSSLAELEAKLFGYFKALSLDTPEKRSSGINTQQLAIIFDAELKLVNMSIIKFCSRKDLPFCFEMVMNITSPSLTVNGSLLIDINQGIIQLINFK